MLSFLTSTGLGNIGGNKNEGFGHFGAPGNFENAGSLFENILSKALGFLTIIGGLWFALQILLGAMTWISAGNNKETLRGAQNKITNAVIGLFILVASYALISIIGSLMGLDILNPLKNLSTIKP